MGSYDVLNTYKEKIKKMFLQNQDLQKLIYYNVDNPLAQPNLLNPNVLFKGETTTVNGEVERKEPKILFKGKNYKTIQEQNIFLLIEFLDAPIYKSTAFKEYQIMITIACHNELLELADGSSRTLLILDKIDDYLNGNKHLGLNKAKNAGTKKIEINDSYDGLRIIFTTNSRSMNYRNENG